MKSTQSFLLLLLLLSAVLFSVFADGFPLSRRTKLNPKTRQPELTHNPQTNQWSETKIDGELHKVLDEDLPICNEEPSNPAEDSFRMLLLIVLMMVCLIGAFMVRQLHSNYFHETTAWIFIGGVCGVIVYFISEDRLSTIVSFNSNFFFLVLLPPIIFESGYNMNKRVFFAHFIPIFLYAIIGTMFSAVVVGVGVWGVNQIGFTDTHLTLIECLCFGALISATDPVTVLAIFKERKVDRNLFANVFGESVLNDAVALVLYETLLEFLEEPVTVEAVGMAGLSFVLINIGSIAVGIIVGVLNAILYKYTSLYEHPMLEFALFVLYSFTSYFLSAGLGLSAIVSILFCGITMAHYTRKNLSWPSKHLSIHFWEAVATMCESFVFLYLGLSVYSVWFNYDIIVIISSIIFCFAARFMHIFPIGAFANGLNMLMARSTKVPAQLPLNHLIMMMYSGLRGGMAFALAMNFAEETENGNIFLTTTIVIVIITVVFLGGLTGKVLDILQIETGDNTSEAQSVHKAGWWRKFDQRFIAPFLTREENPGSPMLDDHHQSTLNMHPMDIELKEVEKERVVDGDDV